MKAKIVIAPDKFKGSLTGIEFCNIVEESLLQYSDEFEVHKVPLADGGDGTVDVIRYYTEGQRIRLEVHDPLMRKIEAEYLYSESARLAFIEMSAASGIRLLNDEELNPMETSTFGTGELILDALSRGAVHIIMGIGGSATNDAGMGMARALGFRFFDKDKNELQGKGKDLQLLHSIDAGQAHQRIHDVKFEIACDVDNPLFGENGAARVYAPQKGADEQMVQMLDKGLWNFAAVAYKNFLIDLQQIAGSGAAGGLGAGCILFLDAHLKSGIELIKSISGFNEKIADAQWIVTGEGSIDSQTFSGKVIKGVLDSRRQHKIAVFCGRSDLPKGSLHDNSIDYLAEILPLASDVHDSMQNAGIYLKMLADEFVRLVFSR